jgi:hypothetical protein
LGENLEYPQVVKDTVIPTDSVPNMGIIDFTYKDFQETHWTLLKALLTKMVNIR